MAGRSLVRGDGTPLWQQLLADLRRRLEDGEFAAALPGEAVALSGGVFQNARLLGMCIETLRAKGHEVFANERVPAGDGGISYGQAAVAAAWMKGDGADVSGDSGDDCIH